jgi:hypothetical protein
MTTTPWKPTPTDHVMIVENGPREPWTSTADKIEAAEARVRDAHQAELAHLDEMATRLAELEGPPTPKPEPNHPGWKPAVDATWMTPTGSSTDGGPTGGGHDS